MTLSRRRFLKDTIAGASLIAAGQLDLVASAADEPKLIPGFSGLIITPKHALYDQARQNYNGRFSLKPASIACCENETDVVKAIEYVREHKIPFVIRSGGHSYEAFSLLDDGMVIDVSNLRSVIVSANKKTATVGSGVRLMQLYEALWDKRVVIPCGSCATVGIAGVTMGGGFGLLGRRMGLTCDNLLALKMVDAGGNIIESNKDKNADLYWALRGGGGGNFGVVTQFTFRLHPINNVTIFRIKWNWSEIVEVVKAWQDWAPAADDRITSILTITSKAAAALKCVGVFIGGEKQAQELIAPLTGAVKPAHVTFSTVPFIEAAKRFSAFKKTKAPGTAVAEPPPEAVHMQVHPRFKNTSDYVRKPLEEEAIRTIIDHLSQSPQESSCVQFDGYGGAINRVPVDETAFCHRGDTKFCIHYQISWAHAKDDAHSLQWINDFRKSMQPFVSGLTYVNYCDRDVQDWAHSCYGENLERLMSIKKKYDPEGLFQFPQSIPLPV